MKIKSENKTIIGVALTCNVSPQCQLRNINNSHYQIGESKIRKLIFSKFQKSEEF